MLSELIHVLEEDSCNWSLQELSRTLGVHPSVVSGMLGWLVDKGRVLEVDPVCGVCETCSLKSKCDVSVYQAKLYKLRTREHRNPDRHIFCES